MKLSNKIKVGVNVNEVIIVIPVYKETLSVCEQISLEQVRRVLGHYPICFMAPEKMREFLSAKGYQAEYFSDKCLSSVQEYSKLLLTPEFYERFAQYEYMLIYQLDAFVFSDRLHYFCSLGYDFMGAPMPYSRNFRTNVGINGGLSLRRINSCMRVAAMRSKIQMDDEMRRMFERAEDKFFSYCGGCKDITFSVPRVAISSDFAVEFNVAHIWNRLSRERLPFGCHAWSKSVYFDVWRPYIEHYIGKVRMDAAASEAFSKGRQDYYADWVFPYIAQYLFERIRRSGQSVRLRAVLDKFISNTKKYIIWGYGEYGHRCLKLFRFLQLPVQCIFEKKAVRSSYDDGTLIIPLDAAMIATRKYNIIIATTRYYDEIKKHLYDIGLQENIDFWGSIDIERILLDGYYGTIWNKFCQR